MTRNRYLEALKWSTIFIGVGVLLVAAIANAQPTGFVTRQESGQVVIVDLSNGTSLGTIPTLGSSPGEIALSPDASTLYVTQQGIYEDENAVDILDVAGASPLQSVVVGSVPIELALLPDGSKLYTADFLGGTVSVINTVTRSKVVSIPTNSLSYDVAAAPDGTMVYATALLATDLFVIDTANDTVVDTIPIGRNFMGHIAITPDGQKAYVTEFRDKVNVIDLSSRTVIGSISFDSGGTNPNNGVLDIAIDPQGRYAYVLGFDTVNIIDLATDTLKATVPIGIQLSDVAIDSTGAFVYVTTLYQDAELIPLNEIVKIETDSFTIQKRFIIGGLLVGLAVGPSGTQVEIDIKPGSDPNSINLKSKGVVPVAILTTPEFDASTVDPTTVKFADASPIKWAIRDVDNDGDMDMLLHFNTQELNLDANSTEGTLSGMTSDGTPFSGTDSVRIVRSRPSPSCTPPPSGLISWWRSEDGVDSVGPNNGILQGGTTNDPGMVGLAFSFDGADDYVEATDIGLPLGSAPRTLEMWVKPAFDARVPFIYGNFDGYDAYYAIVMETKACIGHWGGVPTEPCGKTDVTDGKWHHVALTYDGAIARLYVDGALEVVQKKVYATTSSGRAYIGSTAEGGWEFFTGLVDEVTVYARALKPSEIRAIFASGRAGKCLPVAECFPSPAGLTGWWPGDGNPDDIIGDRSAVLKGGGTTGPGFVGEAFILDGDGDFVDVPYEEELNVGTKDFAVDLWVFFNTTESEQVLVEKYIQRFSASEEFPGSAGWTLTKLGNNVLRLAMADGTGLGIDVDSDELLIPTGIWTHFAATRQDSQVTLFMNGVPVAQGEFSLSLDSSSTLKFGHRGNPEDTPGSEDNRGFFLNGGIDEVELFIGQALTPDQIQAIFNARSAGKCKE
jgi:YVTN family beta-propeller protein